MRTQEEINALAANIVSTVEKFTASEDDATRILAASALDSVAMMLDHVLQLQAIVDKKAATK